MFVMQFLAFLPVIASAVLLVLLWWAEDLRGPWLVACIVWWVAALGMQFFSTSARAVTAGLVLQAALAVTLDVRRRLL